MKIATLVALIVFGLIGMLDVLLILGCAKLEKMRNNEQSDED